MSALHDELASLVADVAAWLRAWEEDGGDQLAAGEAPANAAASVDEPMTVAPTPRPSPPRPVAAPAPPRPMAPPPPRPVTPPPRAPTPVAAPVSAPAPAPAASGAGLFGGGLGKWAAWAAPDPAEQLRAHRSSHPEHCLGCGQRALRLEGDLRGKLVVLAAPMAGEAAEMFDKMLVKVLTLDRTDVLAVAPRECPACLTALTAELAILRPRVILAMGAPARAMVGAEAVGTWGRLGEVDVMPTFHPDELLARPDAKRPAFEHLKLVAARL